MFTLEMNNARKDEIVIDKLSKNSPIVEIFAAMVKGESLDRFGAKANPAVAKIKELSVRAANGDGVAIAEMNAIRRFVVEPLLQEELRLLGVFGTYRAVGFDETIEREVRHFAGEKSREQAILGDVVFPEPYVDRYPVPTFNVSGGYAVDYRRIELGDMTLENEGIAQVRADILNRAKAAIFVKIYNAIKNATGIKYFFEDAGLTKTDVDAVINNVRRIGRPTVVGDYALLSQFTPWAGYVGNINSTDITGISEQAMNEIAQNGAVSKYNGAILAEIENPYDYGTLNADGDNFKTLMPMGIGLVIPTGVRSPIETYTRGNLTTFTGNDVKTGRVLTRFDLEVGVDVAKGREFEIGVIADTNLGVD